MAVRTETVTGVKRATAHLCFGVHTLVCDKSLVQSSKCDFQSLMGKEIYIPVDIIQLVQSFGL